MLLPELVAGLATVYSEIGITLLDEIYFRFTGKRFFKRDVQTYEGQIGQLMAQLSEASSQVDRVLSEMQSTIKQRETDVSALEQKSKELLSRKEDLERLVEDLEQKRLSNETLHEFKRSVDETLSKSERRSDRQNRLYFFAGLLLSIPISIITGIAVNLIG